MSASTYRLESNGVVIAKCMARTWCHGYLDWVADEWPPRNRWTMVRESDGKVIRELEANPDVSVGMIAGWPTPEQYRRAAAKALEKAERIEALERLRTRTP